MAPLFSLGGDMRKLITHDAFMAFRVLNEIGVKEEMAAMANALRERGKTKFDQKAQEEIGIELIMGLLGKAGSEGAEKAVYAFLSGPMEIPAEDLRNMDLLEFMGKLKEFVTFMNLEEWRVFFQSVGKILGK